MLNLNPALYQKMMGTICQDAPGKHLCSCACNCSCHCRCGIFADETYEKALW